MELGAALGLAGLLLAQFSLLWYKLGRVEQSLKDHCAEAQRKKEE